MKKPRTWKKKSVRIEGSGAINEAALLSGQLSWRERVCYRARVRRRATRVHREQVRAGFLSFAASWTRCCRRLRG